MLTKKLAAKLADVIRTFVPNVNDGKEGRRLPMPGDRSPEGQQVRRLVDIIPGRRVSGHGRDKRMRMRAIAPTEVRVGALPLMTAGDMVFTYEIPFAEVSLPCCYF